MPIRVRIVPSRDAEFRAVVGRALRDAAEEEGPGLRPFIVPSERCLRDALGIIRDEYPLVSIRRQEPMARIDLLDTWYVYRDTDPLTWGPVTASEGPSARSPARSERPAQL